MIANLRGGGEFGAAWHDAGRLERKQNVFDDFLASRTTWSPRASRRAAQLALHGGSNGGLLVGAVITQRPDAGSGRAARGRRDGHAPLPPVHDRRGLDLRLRVARGPGDVRDAAGLLAAAQRARGHRLPGDAGDSPATTTTGWCRRTASSSPRRLQHAHAGDAPVLARIETAAGHGLGKPVSVVVAECADQLAFAAEHTGLVPG